MGSGQAVGRIRKLDRSDMLTKIVNFPLQCKEARKVGESFVLPMPRPRHIVISGLGGSAIGGDLVAACLGAGLSVPLFVNRDYGLPAFVNEETLVIAVSYSGMTEETLSAYREGKARSCHLAAITSGGELGEMARGGKHPVAIVPGGMPPRSALGYLFVPLYMGLSRLLLGRVEEAELDEMIELCDKLSQSWAPESKEDNLPLALAEEIQGYLPVIYGSNAFSGAVARRWGTQLNENAKTLAYTHAFPELDHNEVIGWEVGEALAKKVAVIVLRDVEDHARVKLRMEITREIISGRACLWREVQSQGRARLARLMSLVYLGDFLSFYLAMMNEADPTTIDSIDILKRRLKEAG